MCVALKERTAIKKCRKPNHIYLKMRQESSNILNQMVRGLSRFEHLQILISESIKSKIAGNVLQTEQEAEVNNTKKHLLEEECGNMFLEMIKRFPDISWQNKQKKRIRLAILFEANRRFIEHPFDLRGLRHAKVFQNTLNAYLAKVENPKKEKKSSSCLGNMARIINPTRRFVCCVVVAIVATATVGVNLFDYFTDYKVIEIFWEITNKAQDFRNESRVLLIIPASFFMSGVFGFVALFHVRTIFYYVQVNLSNIKNIFP